MKQWTFLTVKKGNQGRQDGGESNTGEINENSNFIHRKSGGLTVIRLILLLKNEYDEEALLYKLIRRI